MKRRNFLKIFSATTVTPFVVNGHAMRPFANSKMAKILGSCDGVEDRTLILIQLKGGNDGLNAVIPTPQYDQYAELRPSIKIPQTDLLNLDSTLPNADQVGLHPSLLPVKELYDSGKACVVQGVGYNSMNQSHFKGTDLWLSGGDSSSANYNIPSGWMGRALQAIYPDVLGAPTVAMPDPLGIQLGDPNPSLGFHTETEHQNALNLSGQDPAGFYSLIQTIGGAPLLNVPDSEQGEQIEFMMGVEQSVNLYAERISQVFNAGSNALTTYPTTNATNSLANQLRTVARLIKGGCKTKVFLCQQGGYDTHSGQVDGGQPTVGDHANLLRDMAEAVKYFMQDIEDLGLADQVVACTFSEFGRCARENGSDGTDHGTLAPMMLFGKNIAAGVLGTNVNLSNLTDDNQLQGVQHDYRQVFATLLQDWIGADNEVLEQTMFDGYAKVGVVDAAAVVGPDCYLGSGGGVSTWSPNAKAKALKVWPSPARVNVEVSFQSATAYDARLTLHSLGGSLLYGSSVRVEADENIYFMDVSELPAGNYFVRLENKANGRGEVAKIQVVR
jgi:uncharacterized protein (DUF1501 family)